MGNLSPETPNLPLRANIMIFNINPNHKDDIFTYHLQGIRIFEIETTNYRLNLPEINVYSEQKGSDNYH